MKTSGKRGTRRRLVKDANGTEQTDCPADNCAGAQTALPDEDERTGGNTEDISQVFSTYAIYILIAFTLLTRLGIVTSNDGAWLVHPDEVYQSIEVAHSEVYGYGFRPYEFLTPPAEGQVPSPSEERHASLGMHSMRSWLHPRIYEGVFWLHDQFNWTDFSPFQVARLFHATVASMLPLVIHHFAFAVYQDSDTALISAIFVAFAQPLIVLGTHTFVQSLVSPILFGVLTVLLKSESTKQSKSGNVVYFLCGVICGLVVSIRMDTILLLTVTALTLPRRFILREFFTLKSVPKLWFGVGIVVGLCIGGYNDYSNYGRWFVSSWRWLYFQINFASKLFGSQPIFTYVTLVFGSSKTTTVLGILSLLLWPLSLLFKRTAIVERHGEIMTTWQRLWIASIALLAVYSLHNHKEIRFIHDTLVLFQVSVAGIAIVIVRELWSILAPYTGRRFFTLILYGELLLYSLDGRVRCPRSSDQAAVSAWAYAGLTESGLVNQCLAFVGRQKDVTGVLVDYSIYMTGSYALLHQDVPVIGKTNFGFREWDQKARLVLDSHSHFGKGVRVSTVDRVSNFISVHNVPLLLKYIIGKPEYNYFITTGGRRLPRQGFVQVFNSSKDIRVYKRSKLRSDKEALRQMAEQLPIGTNATVLEYEGSWLVTLEAYVKAVERLRAALSLDSGRIRAWQLLHWAFVQLDDVENAQDVLQQCYQLHGEEKCKESQQKVVLHPELNLNI